jgi:hypothetical protein
MRISIIVEGKTEKVFMPCLRDYLNMHLAGRMPNLDPLPYNGRIPTGSKLQRVVDNLLADEKKPVDHVIALTDVYTGTQPPDFVDAADAKKKMQNWVGREKRFHPHAAQHDFEAWLLPYWSSIQRLTGHNKAAPEGNPETVDHNNPPSYRIKEIFRIGRCRNDYVKTRDAGRILRDNDLSIAVSQCSELKAFVNTIITLCGGNAIP